MSCVAINRDKILEVERLGKSPESDQPARLQLNMNLTEHHLAYGANL